MEEQERDPLTEEKADVEGHMRKHKEAVDQGSDEPQTGQDDDFEAHMKKLKE